MEKRRSPRVVSLNLVSYTAFDDEGVLDSEDFTRTLNLSPEGMLLEMKSAPPICTILNMSIGLMDDVIQVQSKVVRLEELPSGKIAVGIAFLKISEAHRQLLEAYLEGKNEG